jgi:hypothetical protein
MALKQLFEELNLAKVYYPGTEMQMKYVLAASSEG